MQGAGGTEDVDGNHHVFLLAQARVAAKSLCAVDCHGSQGNRPALGAPAMEARDDPKIGLARSAGRVEHGGHDMHVVQAGRWRSAVHFRLDMGGSVTAADRGRYDAQIDGEAIDGLGAVAQPRP